MHRLGAGRRGAAKDVTSTAVVLRELGKPAVCCGGGWAVVGAGGFLPLRMERAHRSDQRVPATQLPSCPVPPGTQNPLTAEPCAPETCCCRGRGPHPLGSASGVRRGSDPARAGKGPTLGLQGALRTRAKGRRPHRVGGDSPSPAETCLAIAAQRLYGCTGRQGPGDKRDSDFKGNPGVAQRRNPGSLGRDGRGFARVLLCRPCCFFGGGRSSLPSSPGFVTAAARL